ncbi:acyl-CoA dehydrogenase [Streptomyces sp. NPDC002308]
MTSHQIRDNTPRPPLSLTADLTKALYGGRLAEMHDRWRGLFSSAPFSFREGLTREERIELSYERLRLVRAAVPGRMERFVADAAELSALHEWAGVDPGMATVSSIHFNLFLGSLVDHGRTGDDLAEFTDRIGTFLCTELSHGNDAARCETTATFDRKSGEFVLDTPTPGAAKFMPNTSSAGGAKAAVVAARLLVDGTDHGIFLFLTPLSDADGVHLRGIEVRELAETASAPVDHCVTTFRGVRLPYEAMLQGDHGRLTREGEFSSAVGSPRRRYLHSIGRVTMGKLCMSGYSLGATRHALAVTMRLSHDRVTSSMTTRAMQPLIEHRSHHAPLLEAVATTYAATLLHRSVVTRWTRAADGTDEDRAACERDIAVAKTWITWEARRTMTTCRERSGARGLFLGHGIAMQLAANEGTITAEGDNQVVAAKAGGEMALGAIALKPPSEIPSAERLLTDPQFQLDLLADVERIWHGRASEERHQPAPSASARWNNIVGPALTLVDAHVRRRAGEEMLTAAARAGSDQGRRLLLDLFGLFALRQVAAHSGDLLAEGRMTADQVRSLHKVTGKLLDVLVPHSLSLVEGFAVPDALLESNSMLNP